MGRKTRKVKGGKDIRKSPDRKPSRSQQQQMLDTLRNIHIQQAQERAAREQVRQRVLERQARDLGLNRQEPANSLDIMQLLGLDYAEVPAPPPPRSTPPPPPTPPPRPPPTPPTRRTRSRSKSRSRSR